jgi:hypothetical protein
LNAEIEVLKKKIQTKETEIASVKKQAGQNATAYEELSGPVSLGFEGYIENLKDGRLIPMIYYCS